MAANFLAASLLLFWAVTATQTTTSSAQAGLRRPLLSHEFVGSQDVRRLEPVTDFSMSVDAASPPRAPHRRRGLGEVEQPFPDTVHVRFSAFNRTFDHTLTVMAHMYDEDSRVIVVGENGTRTSVPHRLVSYSSLGKDHSVSITILRSGLVHGVFVRDGEIFQLDPVEEHRAHLPTHHFRALQQRAPHGLAMFRRSDRTVGLNARCGEPIPNPTRTPLLATSYSEPRVHTHADGHIHADGHGHGHGHGRGLAGSDDAGDPTRWTNCYKGDSVDWRLSMGFAVDKTFYDWAGGSTSATQDKVAAILADSNTVYSYQMGIHLHVAEWYIMSAGGKHAWNDGNADNCMGIGEKLQKFAEWSAALTDSSSPGNQGLWHLMTNCYPCGTVGLAHLTTICETGRGSNTGVSGQGRCADWGTVAHEIGHNFGGQHSFEEGQGRTGGIMDYGDGLLNGVYQFNTKYRQTAMCAELDRNINCKHFSSYSAQCGNGVVEKGEECECPTGTNCACCKSCQLPANAECSQGDCCDTRTCKYKSAATTCAGGTQYCLKGECADPVCARYGMELCGVHDGNQCKVKCTYNGGCSTLQGVTDRGTGQPINRVPDGARCTASGGALGTCASGECEAASAPSPSPGGGGGVPSPAPETFSWVKGSYGACSVSCGPGKQTRSVTCQGSRSGAVSDGKCAGAGNKPATERSCNKGSCTTYEWTAGTYTACSTSCGGGTQARVGSACVAKVGSTTTSVSNSLCTQNAKNAAPPSSKSCNTAPCATRWVTGSYSACNKACGGGTQTRTVSCVQTKDGADVKTNFNACAGNPPQSSRSCNTQACEEYDWSTSGFGPCRTADGATCGKGTRVRTVRCVETRTGALAPNENRCDGGAKPATQDACDLGDCPKSTHHGWVERPWGGCSVSCGEGVRYRDVLCRRGKAANGKTDPNGQIVLEEFCTLSKPRTSEECVGAADAVCPVWKFVAEPWGKCQTAGNEGCGSGFKTRVVRCHDEANDRPCKLQQVQCDALCRSQGLTLPERGRACNLGPCEEPPEGSSAFWRTSSWTSCSRPCGFGVQTRTVTCTSPVTLRPVQSKRCRGARPQEKTDCNAFACPRFHAGAWGPCSAACDDGVRNRTVTCRNHVGAVVPGNECEGQQRPEEQSACNVRPCPHWHRGLWSDCTATCGGGTQERELSCRLPHDDRYLGIRVRPSDVPAFCPAVLPDSEQACGIEPCSEFFWKPSAWSACSKECGAGGGVMRRELVCTSKATQQAAPGGSCPKETRPDAERKCNDHPCPVYAWAVHDADADLGASNVWQAVGAGLCRAEDCGAGEECPAHPFAVRSSCAATLEDCQAACAGSCRGVAFAPAEGALRTAAAVFRAENGDGNAVRGTVTFAQPLAGGDMAIQVDLQLSPAALLAAGLDGAPSAGHRWQVLDGGCDGDGGGARFDPSGKENSRRYSCDEFEECSAGDFAGKFGPLTLPAAARAFSDPLLDFSLRDIEGRSLAVFAAGDGAARIACAPIAPPAVERTCAEAGQGSCQVYYGASSSSSGSGSGSDSGAAVGGSASAVAGLPSAALYTCSRYVGEEWAPCSQQCGGGEQARLVECRDTTGDEVFGYKIPYEIVGDALCAGAAGRPADTRQCNAHAGLCGAGGAGLCGSAGACDCAPGYGGEYCTGRPFIRDVRLLADEFIGGIPHRDVVELQWEAGASLSVVDILLQPPGKNVLPIPVTSPERYPNDRIFLFSIPDEAPFGENYTLRVFFNDSVSASSNEFTIADPCFYLSCGEHGTCADGQCSCADGYTGPTCAISPCAAAGCNPSPSGGVASCSDSAYANGTSGCTCKAGFTGDVCQHALGCEDACVNGGIAPAVASVGAGSGAAEECQQCVCPAGTAWRGERCEQCGLSCAHGRPNAECTACECAGDSGWFGQACHCRYFDVELRLAAQADRLLADPAAFEVAFSHDVLKALYSNSNGDAAQFEGGVRDVRATAGCGGGCVDVQFRLAEACAEVPLADASPFPALLAAPRAGLGSSSSSSSSSSLSRRALADASTDGAALAQAYRGLFAQSEDKWSVLRSQGIVSSAFDAERGMGATDPTGTHSLPGDLETGELGTGAVVGIVIGALLGAGLLAAGGLYVYRNRPALSLPSASKSKFGKKLREKRMPPVVPGMSSSSGGRGGGSTIGQPTDVRKFARKFRPHNPKGVDRKQSNDISVSGFQMGSMAAPPIRDRKTSKFEGANPMHGRGGVPLPPVREPPAVPGRGGSGARKFRPAQPQKQSSFRPAAQPQKQSSFRQSLERALPSWRTRKQNKGASAGAGPPQLPPRASAKPPQLPTRSTGPPQLPARSTGQGDRQRKKSTLLDTTRAARGRTAWQRVRDQDTGDYYYWNEDTDETSWERPFGVAIESTLSRG